MNTDQPIPASVDKPAREVAWQDFQLALAGAGLLLLLIALSPWLWFLQPLRLALGLMMGGAAGNMIDRLTVGHVTDFLSVGNFPVFNVADSSITVGVVVLILGVWADDRRTRQQENLRLAAEQSAAEAALDEINSQNSVEQGPVA